MAATRLNSKPFTAGAGRPSLSIPSFFREPGATRAPATSAKTKAGTVLIREYQGRRHTVTTVLYGFEWQGTTYRSLPAIARAITGTAWSGPRFFALQRAADGSKSKRQSTAAPDNAGLSAGSPGDNGFSERVSARPAP